MSSFRSADSGGAIAATRQGWYRSRSQPVIRIVRATCPDARERLRMCLSPHGEPKGDDGGTPAFGRFPSRSGLE